MNDNFYIGSKSFTSRLIVGSGKYQDFTTTKQATLASGAEIITVAVRRVNIMDNKSENLLEVFKDTPIQFLPNSAGCVNAKEAITLFRLVKEATGIDFIKLEIIGDTQKTLYPDVLETLKATETLANEGFCVLAYTNDDPVMAKRLEDAGASAVMPLAAPIGSGLGIQNRYNIGFIKEAIKVPLIVDAGVGCASDASVAMELGADAVLTNTAIAMASNPILMAEAMKNAVLAGRQSYLAGRIPRKAYASASSPIEGMAQLS
ncbi:thiazole synthase [Helicobacter sp. MIT 05-5293]|uniref:Thiazole synthase n=1 Tax=uncultured Helicobacter sp. TaxID=175537 RepID=A0A650EKV3_9HELI|nr:thiazole synthase [Helicobacter sp. MIT 05-5293]QGT50407.1 thiazole synthase [uncultured Helicobacter sp.]TLD82169.1 thiazole synthase [Helicobacter sp. MIT 05-5293]